MRGRYSLHAPPNVIALQFGLAHPPEVTARYNIAAGNPVLVVRAGPGGTRVASLLRWGFVPSWAKDPSIGHRMINARAETVAEKPAFRGAFRSRRCILPASGYYEWQATGGPGQPWYIRPHGDGLFGFAGLYERWTPPIGEAIDSCTILTTRANERLKDLHDRMPVILPVSAYARWLDPVHPDPASLVSLLEPCPPEQIALHPVSPAVNRVRNDGPALIEPLAAGPERLV